MDIKCRICAEPWDVYELHEMGDYVGKTLTFDQARARFYKLGCGAFDERGKKCSRPAAEQAIIISELQYLLGDDVDGLAAMEEDFGL